MGESHWLWDVFSATGRINAYLLYKRYVTVREKQTVHREGRGNEPIFGNSLTTTGGTSNATQV